MATTLSPAQRVFGIYELLESIIFMGAYEACESSWSIRESLGPAAFLARMRSVNRLSRAIVLGSDKLQDLMQNPVNYISSCPSCGRQDAEHEHTYPCDGSGICNKCHCVLSRHHEPIIWLLKHQLRNNVQGYQSFGGRMILGSFWRQARTEYHLTVDNRLRSHQDVKEIPRFFMERKSDVLASWRKVKVPKTKVIVKSTLPYVFVDMWKFYPAGVTWEFGEEATLGEVFDKYCEHLWKENDMAIEGGTGCLA